MTDPRLVDYIKRGLADGIKKEQINALLIEAGWTQHPIDAGFKEAGSEKHVNQGSGASALDKLRHWLLILIGVRLVLIPIQMFLVPLVLRANYADAFIAGDLVFGLALPLLWLWPFLLIWRRKKIGYVVAILFSVVLIYLNMVGFAYLLSGNIFGILSAIYFITGLAIIGLSIRSFKYLPSKFEQPNTLMPIDESNIPKARWIITSIVTLVVLASGLFVASQGGIDFGYGGGRLDSAGGLTLGAIFGIVFGLHVAQKLIDCVRYNRPWMGTGIFAGFVGGAIAQIPVWGLSGILVIAMPIGAVVGMLVAALGGGWILYSTTQGLLGKK